MENSKYTKALNMMDALIEKEKNTTIAEFRAGYQDLTFDEVLSLGKEYSEIAKDVLVKIEKKVSETYFILRCKMKDKAELLRHQHSDYNEEFKMLKGALFDKVSNTFTSDNITFPKSAWHNMVAVGDAEMLIHCIKA